MRKNRSVQHRSHQRPGRSATSARRVLGEWLEARLNLAVIFWDGDAGTNRWEDSSNWTDDVPPGPDDDVVLFPGDPVVHVSAGQMVIHALASDRSLNFTAGTLSVAAESYVSENFSLGPDATLTGAGDFTVSNTLYWSGGSMRGSGRTIIPHGAILDISGSTDKLVDARTLELLGRTNSTGSGWINNQAGATWNNQPGAIFEIRSSAEMRNAGSAGPFNNAELLVKSTDSGTTAIGLHLQNTGTLRVEAGHVTIVRGANSGQFDVHADSTISHLSSDTLPTCARLAQMDVELLELIARGR